MDAFIHNKAGEIRFSPRDAEWLTLFSAEANSVVIQVQGLQKQSRIDRQYINDGAITPETPDSKLVPVISSPETSQ